MAITFDRTTPSWESWTGVVSLDAMNTQRTDPPCGLHHDGWGCTRDPHATGRHLAGGSDGRVFHAWPGLGEPTATDLED